MISIAGALTWHAFKGPAWSEIRAIAYWRKIFIIYPLLGVGLFILTDQPGGGRFLSLCLVPDLGLFVCGILIVTAWRRQNQVAAQRQIEQNS